MRSLFVGLFLLAWINSLDAAGQQYAFLVGVGTYDEKELKSLAYSRQDILEFRSILIESLVPPENITLMVDDPSVLSKTQPVGRYLPETEKIKHELGLLISNLEPEDTFIVALAGHGVQFQGDSEHYFCPSNANLRDRNTLLSLRWLYRQLEYDPVTMKGCQARQRLLIVDACRNDPQSRLGRGTDTPKLESVTRPQITPPPKGVVALFSCAEGQQAFEHPPLKHGVFFYHILEAWRGRGDGDSDRELTLDELIAFTKSKTQAYARNELRATQTPRQNGFVDGRWVLRSLTQTEKASPSEGVSPITVAPGDGTIRMKSRVIVRPKDRSIDEVQGYLRRSGEESNETVAVGSKGTVREMSRSTNRVQVTFDDKKLEDTWISLDDLQLVP